MAARSPRKRFANPFVITLAAIPACSAPPQPQPQPPQVTPAPDPKPTDPPIVMTNPPPPNTGTPPTEQKPGTFAFDQHWTVMKSGTECHAMAKVDCPKPSKTGAPVPTCNPPPPIKYACPAGWDGKTAFQITQYANQENCFVDANEPVKCPPNATCNPPPPKTVTCPKY